ncbi:MAG: sugar phosphate isomerase/epimerase [Acidobacteria bacterium]|nr:sugar phosphate isomerase/epimerase [Acidobacteriota bacterium]MCI0723116.1 sugar phosphate isomerase/epimerase [Acidobacteriota bacterium]
MAHTSVFILTPDFPEPEGCEMLAGAYAESLSAAKRMGYDGVEIVMGDPDQFDVGAFKALLLEHNLRVSAMNCGGIQYLFKASLVNADMRKMELALEKLKSYIRHCRELGCIQQVGVARGFAVPGRPMRWFKDCLVDVLKEAAAYAAQLEVTVVFEYTNRFEINTINTGAEAREIVDRVGSPNLGILIDTGHSFLEDPDVYQNIWDLNGRVWHFHLHDSNGGAAIIGGGENDFDRIIQTCGQIGYHGWFSDGLLTLKYSEDELRRSTATLRQLYQKYGV